MKVNKFMTPAPIEFPQAVPGATTDLFCEVIIDGDYASPYGPGYLAVGPGPNYYCTGDITKIKEGKHKFELRYYIQNVEYSHLILAHQSIWVTVKAGVTVPAGFAPALFTLPDDDSDGWSNLEEITNGSNATGCTDKDGDGYGLELVTTICPHLGVDCNDGDSSNWMSCSTCKDNDGDGYYAGCDAYNIHLGPDCNDNNNAHWNDCAVCIDGDGDNYGTNCDQGADCNDFNVNAWNTCATCMDGDADSWFGVCNAYNGISGPDCDDADPDNWNACANCRNLDGDTWSVGCNAYVNRHGPDCNDNSSAHWNDCAVCIEADGDGHGLNCNLGADSCDNNAHAWNTGPCVTCIDTDGDSYFGVCDSYSGIQGPDCDDTDPDNWVSCVTCVDHDLDGYFIGCDAYATRNGAEDCYDWDSSTHAGVGGCIPAGCFDMGDNFGDGATDDIPVHQVCVNTFQIQTKEISNYAYRQCVQNQGCANWDNCQSYWRPTEDYCDLSAYNNFPAVMIRWEWAKDYCEKQGWRLPTEAEWEYAARGGQNGKRYPWGDSIACSNTVWGLSSPGSGVCVSFWGSEDTKPVASAPTNGYGLYLMSGGVFEFVSDWYQPDYYQYCVDQSLVNNPQGPLSGTQHIIRGGSWMRNSSGQCLQNACRQPVGLQDQSQSHEIGFRCVRDNINNAQ